MAQLVEELTAWHHVIIDDPNIPAGPIPDHVKEGKGKGKGKGKWSMTQGKWHMATEDGRQVDDSCDN